MIQARTTAPTSLIDAPPWWHIWTNMAGITHPPLYHVVLRWWMDLFGTSAAATRLLSACLSLIAIVVFYDLCRLLHGARIALLGSALMAVSGAQLEFAQQTRSYAMLIFLGLCAGNALIRIEKLGATQRRLILLATAISATALTHYFSAGLLSAIFVYAIVRLRGRERIQTMGAFFAGGMLVLILWGIPMLHQMQSLPSAKPDFLFASDPHNIQSTLRRLIGIPGELIIGQNQAAELHAAVFVCLGILIYLLPIARLRRRPDLLFWIFWIAGTIGLLAVSDLTRSSILLAYLRYAILAGPAVFAILASIDWPHRPVLADTVGFFLLALSVLFLVGILRDPPQEPEDWRGLAGYIKNTNPDDLLVFYGNDPWISPGMWATGFWYFSPDSTHPWLILSHTADDTLLQQLRLHQQVWLIGKFPAEDGPILLPGWRCTTEFQNTAGRVGKMVRITSNTENAPNSTRP